MQHRIVGPIEWDEEFERGTGRVGLDFFADYDASSPQRPTRASPTCNERYPDCRWFDRTGPPLTCSPSRPTGDRTDRVNPAVW